MYRKKLLLTPSTRKGVGRCSSVSIHGRLLVCVYDDSMLQSGLYYSMGVVNEGCGTMEWGTAKKYGTGQRPSVSLVEVAGELYAVECHSSLRACYCRAGKVDIEGGCIMWGVRSFLCNGCNPKISSNDDGVVVILMEEACSLDGLIYFTGRVKQQDVCIDWTLRSMPTSLRGIEPDIAINRNIVVAIYRSRVPWIHLLIAKLGRLDSDSSITWFDSDHALKSAGTNPAISLDSDGNIVEIHQTLFWKQLDICCGRISQNSIVWGEQGKVINGEYPTVSLSDDRLLFEMHATPIESRLVYSLGKLE